MLTLSLSPEMLQIIDVALQAMPWRQANPVIEEINRQLRETMEAEEKALRHGPDSMASQHKEAADRLASVMTKVHG